MIKSAAVAGLPDPKLGEVVATFIMISSDGIVDDEDDKYGLDMRICPTLALPARVLANNQASLTTLTPSIVRQHVQDHLAKHLIPKYIFWVDGMPMTPSGKVEKFKLQALALQALHDADTVPVTVQQVESLTVAGVESKPIMSQQPQGKLGTVVA